ncbi:MAG: serine hydrolase [Pirellulales bacterium]
MILLRAIICLSLLQLQIGALAADSDAALSPVVERQIVDAVTKHMETAGIPGMSVAVAIDDELVYSAGFGLQDVEHNVPVTADTLFRTASIAKSMTAVAIMQLVERGKIDLDTPVQRYVPDFPEKEWPVTVRQLLNHTAGIRHYDGARRRETYSTTYYPSVQQALDTFADDPLQFEPGKQHHYSTFGYNLLGAVVEGASGMDFMAQLGASIFASADMEQTRTDDHFAMIPNRARGYLRMNDEIREKLPRRLRERFEPGELYNAPMHDTSMKVPGGGLLSTAPDLIRFATALNRGQLLKPETLAIMWTDHKLPDGTSTGYGLGFRLRELAGQQVVGHSGGQSGVSTFYVLCPERRAAVALMCNLQGAPLEPLIMNVLALAAGVPTEPDATQAQSTEDYQEIDRRLSAFIEHEIKDKQIPAVSIALVDDGKLVWSKGFGQQNPEQKADGDSVYRVGSVTKLFTDLAVMQLVAAGKLDLDADVQAYLPDFNPKNPFGVPITLRQIMSHQAGLVRESPVGNYFDETEPSLADTVMSLNGTTLVYKPGSRTKYSNAGIALAGLVVERVAGKPFEEYVQETILEPLKMSNSGFRATDAINAKLAHALMHCNHAPPFPAPTFVLGTFPAGNLYASMNELSNFLVAILNQGKFGDTAVIQPAVLNSMLTPVVGSGDKQNLYGIGFRLGEIDGHRTFGHGGAVYGYSTQLVGLPDEKLGVVASASLDCSNGFVTRLTDYAVRLLLAKREGKPLPEIKSTKPIPDELRDKLLGTFSSGHQFITIDDYEGTLKIYDGLFYKRLRSLDGKVIVDDPIGVGPTIEVTDDGKLVMGDQVWARNEIPCPSPAPERWKGLIGEYGPDHIPTYIFEDRGQLWVLIEWFFFYPLSEIAPDVFAFPDEGMYFGEQLVFERDDSGKATSVTAAGVTFNRRNIAPDEGVTFKIEPQAPIDLLYDRARADSPPVERGNFRQPDFVEFVKLDPSIKLDVRYATTNNFMNSVFYKQPRAFMQRPAAEAVVRANEWLKERGYGLLIHDAYRPWYVTKMFWDGTPPHLRDFVADPEKGSKHNRGCAVDLTLYDLATGEPITMVAGYDEMSPRSYPFYPGGDAHSRWHRRLLREAMNREGFSIYPLEWWHFDYKDWEHYPIGTVSFEEIDVE